MFNSRFESGNLMYAFESSGEETHSNSVREFFLVLQNDINSKGYGNWFYFKILSKLAKTLHLHILNAQKNFSFFNYGMRPTVFSLKKNKANGTQWHYDCYELSYHRNNMPKDSNTQGFYNTLSFKLTKTS